MPPSSSIVLAPAGAERAGGDPRLIRRRSGLHRRRRLREQAPLAAQGSRLRRVLLRLRRRLPVSLISTSLHFHSSLVLYLLQYLSRFLSCAHQHSARAPNLALEIVPRLSMEWLDYSFLSSLSPKSLCSAFYCTKFVQFQLLLGISPNRFNA